LEYRESNGVAPKIMFGENNAGDDHCDLAAPESIEGLGVMLEEGVVILVGAAVSGVDFAVGGSKDGKGSGGQAAGCILIRLRNVHVELISAILP
jgi:hypothetical protein